MSIKYSTFYDYYSVKEIISEFKINIWSTFLHFTGIFKHTPSINFNAAYYSVFSRIINYTVIFYPLFVMASPLSMFLWTSFRTWMWLKYTAEMCRIEEKSIYNLCFSYSRIDKYMWIYFVFFHGNKSIYSWHLGLFVFQFVCFQTVFL